LFSELSRVEDYLSEALHGNDDDLVQNLESLNEYLEDVELGELDVRMIASFLSDLKDVSVS
jgi:hypothetical protein